MSSVSRVEEISLFVMIVVRGCCILVLMLVVNSKGVSFKVVVIVVIRMGLVCILVVLIVSVFWFCLVWVKLFMKFIRIILLLSVILNNVMKLIVVGIEIGRFVI